MISEFLICVLLTKSYARFQSITLVNWVLKGRECDGDDNKQ
jgi:hypothetical protein